MINPEHEGILPTDRCYFRDLAGSRHSTTGFDMRRSGSKCCQCDGSPQSASQCSEGSSYFEVVKALALRKK